MKMFRWMTTSLLVLLLVACGGGTTATAPTSPPAPTAAPKATEAPKATATPQPSPTPEIAVAIESVTFAKGLTDEKAAVDPTKEFKADETVYLVVTLKGRPKKGIVSAKFLLGKDTVADAKVDLSDANSGVLFSLGQSTNVGYTLTHAKPFPLSKNYHAEVYLDDAKLGDYPFSVVPPSDAIPSKVSSAVLAKGADDNYVPQDETTTFAPAETVYLVGKGDFGEQTWLQADWLVDGKVVDEGTRSLTLKENSKDTGFAFSFLPKGGWPTGKHQVRLTMNDEVVDTYAFTIDKDAASTVPTKPTAAASDTTAEPASDATSAPADSADVPTLALAEPETYTFPTKLFTIDVPKDWDRTDLSDENGAYVFWIHPSGLASASIFINEHKATMTEQELGDELKKFITTIRTDENAKLTEPKTQADGSVLIGWSYADDYLGKAVPIQALGYVEQRGDKLSIIAIDMPADQYERMWAEGVQKLANSYKIDPTAPIK